MTSSSPTRTRKSTKLPKKYVEFLHVIAREIDRARKLLSPAWRLGAPWRRLSGALYRFGGKLSGQGVLQAGWRHNTLQKERWAHWFGKGTLQPVRVEPEQWWDFWKSRDDVKERTCLKRGCERYFGKSFFCRQCVCKNKMLEVRRVARTRTEKD